MTALFFVTGAHGVGKSTLCSACIAARPTWIHRSASSIIREQAVREGMIASDDAAKITLKPDENQELLLRGVEQMRMTTRVLLLDGHTVLRGPDGTLVDIDMDIFRRLQPTAIVHIIDDPAQILDRWQGRRPTPGVDLAFVTSLQRRESVRVTEFLPALKIPTFTLSAGDPALLNQTFLSLVDRLVWQYIKPTGISRNTTPISHHE